MAIVLTIDINLLAVCVLLVVFLSMTLQKTRRSVSTRLFRVLVGSTMILLLHEVAIELTDGLVAGANGWIAYLIAIVYLFATPIPVVVWLCYVDYRIHGSPERLKARFYYAHFLVANIVLTVVAILSGYMFYIDDANTLQIGPAILVLGLLDYAVIVYAVLVAVWSRRSIERRTIVVMLCFAAIPVAGFAAQAIYPWLWSTWPSVTLGILITYIFLEVQKTSRDYLTGVYNRRQVDEWIHQRIREVTRRGRFSLIMVDLDDFKRINDEHGHKEGDFALVTFATILGRSVKRADMVARFAGDEFLLVVETDNPEDLETIVARIYENIEEYNRKAVAPYRLEFSAGSIIFDPDRCRGYEELLHAVDTAMYMNKRRRKAAHTTV